MAPPPPRADDPRKAVLLLLASATVLASALVAGFGPRVSEAWPFAGFGTLVHFAVLYERWDLAWAGLALVAAWAFVVMFSIGAPYLAAAAAFALLLRRAEPAGARRRGVGVSP